MTFMPWTDELRIGIDLIDEQHRWLVDSTNALHDEISKPAPSREAIGEILFGLVDYTMNHFIVEEELFQRHSYEAEAAHKAEHNQFTASVTNLLDRHEAGEQVDEEALGLLKDWLTHHILKVDKAYVPWMKAQGIR